MKHNLISQQAEFCSKDIGKRHVELSPLVSLCGKLVIFELSHCTSATTVPLKEFPPQARSLFKATLFTVTLLYWVLFTSHRWSGQSRCMSRSLHATA